MSATLHLPGNCLLGIKSSASDGIRIQERGERPRCIIGLLHGVCLHSLLHLIGLFASGALPRMVEDKLLVKLNLSFFTMCMSSWRGCLVGFDRDLDLDVRQTQLGFLFADAVLCFGSHRIKRV